MLRPTVSQTRLLLINPSFPESFWSFQVGDGRHPARHPRAINPPLGLATLAALCPPHWDVSIVDENIESIPLAPEADIVGICGMGVQFARQRELLAYYRSRGLLRGGRRQLCLAVPGELFATSPTRWWPARPSTSGRSSARTSRRASRPLYQETGTVALADSPAPRFDLLKLDRYSNATLQFSRGCPFRCEFCDIIVMFGRKPRVKSAGAGRARAGRAARATGPAACSSSTTT